MTIYSLVILLSQFERIHCPMSDSNCCFLTCIQVSQEAGKVVWYSHLFKNDPQFVVTHTVKGYYYFTFLLYWSSRYFSETPLLFQWSNGCWQSDLWFLCLFLNPASTCGSSWFTYCWSLAWRILSITLIAREMSAIVWWFEHSLALPFFGTGMKTDLFQSRGHCWVFQIC